jgi:hypothetical protein
VAQPDRATVSQIESCFHHGSPPFPVFAVISITCSAWLCYSAPQKTASTRAVCEQKRGKKLCRGYRDEVKWQTTRTWDLAHRKAYVDLLAELVRDRLAHFHIRFAQFSAYSHEGTRKRFDTTSKMFYQLLLHRAVRHYGSEDAPPTGHDLGTSSRSLGAPDPSFLPAALAATVADDVTIGSIADRRLLSGVIQTSHFKGVRTVFYPNSDLRCDAQYTPCLTMW